MEYFWIIALFFLKVINIFYACCLIKDIRQKLSEYSWCEEEYEDARWRPLPPPCNYPLPTTRIKVHPGAGPLAPPPPPPKGIFGSIPLERSDWKRWPRMREVRSCGHVFMPWAPVDENEAVQSRDFDVTNEVIVDLSVRPIVTQHNFSKSITNSNTCLSIEGYESMSHVGNVGQKFNRSRGSWGFFKWPIVTSVLNLKIK